MNPTFVFLGIAIAVIIYLIYIYWYDTSSKLSDYKSISSAELTISGISMPTTRRYAYGIWVFVNNWETTGEKNIYKVGNARLYLEKFTPTLVYETPLDNGSTTKVTITDNFPIQKWVHLVVSVDNDIVDAYIDGKMVRSQRTSTVAVTESSGTTPGSTTATPTSSTVTCGKMDAYITRFKRWTHPLNPQTVYDQYMKGNGRTGIMPAYGVDVAVFKDNLEHAKFKLF